MRSSLAACLAFAFAACSTSSPTAQAPFVRCALPADGSAPAFLDVPYPSDVYLSAAHVVTPPPLDAFIPEHGEDISRELGALDGFSRIGFSFFDVDDPSAPKTDSGEMGWAAVDGATLPASEAACTDDASAVFLLDLAATDPTKARVPCRAAFHDDSVIGSTVRPLLAVGPARGIVLAEGARYVAVVTDRVRTLSHASLQPGAGFESARASVPLYRDAYATVTTLLGDALAKDGAKVVALAPFTTHTRVKELFDARTAMESMPVPALRWDATSLAPMGAVRFAKPASGMVPAGFVALDDYFGVATAKLPDGTDDNDVSLPVRAHDHIAALGTAVFEATNYLEVGDGAYDHAGNYVFARDAQGHITPSPDHPTQKIWVSIGIPDAPMPVAGYPTVVIQHGLSSSREYVLELMNVFCSRGWIALGIDSVTFGARATEAMYQVDLATDYESAPGAKYKGPDGIADAVLGARNGPLDLFGNFANLGAFRDQLREAALDTNQLMRVLRSQPDLSPLATGAVTPKIDTARIAYFGESLGSVEGAVAAAIEPTTKLWALSVAGGGVVMEAGNHGPGIATFLSAGAALNFALLHERLDQSSLIANLIQQAIEPADPLLFAPHLVASPVAVAGAPAAPRNVLQLEALYDELIGNEGGEAFARAGGWGLATPNVGGNAGVRDLKHVDVRNDPVPLASIAQDGSGAIHDTPAPGITAAVVQFGPGSHGSDIVSSKGTHHFAIPFARYDTTAPFTPLDPTFDVRNPYRELAHTVTDFFASGFSGGAPDVVVYKPAVRDFDDDGAQDDVDPDPSNPAVH